MHPFEKAGLGKAPFRCVGVTENVWTSGCGTIQKAGGTCDYCGTGIRYEYIIISADNHRHVVGCDCVERTGQAELTDGYKQVRRTFLREKREVKAKITREARQAKWEADRKESALARKVQWIAANIDFAASLDAYAGTNSLLLGMKDNLEKWGSLTDAQMQLTTRVMEQERVRNELKTTSKYIGEVGERVTMKSTVVFSKCVGQQTFYPFPAIYLVKLVTADGSQLTWFTSSSYNVGDTFSKFTVKKHEEYDNTKQTIVSRVK
jgi:hypothetical protein